MSLALNNGNNARLKKEKNKLRKKRRKIIHTMLSFTVAYRHVEQPNRHANRIYGKPDENERTKKTVQAIKILFTDEGKICAKKTERNDGICEISARWK